MKRTAFLTTDAAAVRAEHRAAHARVMAALEAQGDALSDTGWRLFSRIAWCLYIDGETIEEVTPLAVILDPGWPASARRAH